MQIGLERITKVYRQREEQTLAVADVSLRIPSGEFFFLLGPSGCGKTTLLRIVAGLIAPTEGAVVFGGTDVTNLPVEKRRTAMVFQSYALWPHMTVRQNVEFGPQMQRVRRPQRRGIAKSQLQRVHMLEYARRKPNQLSGGQQQRVALARALAAQADCLLLDEPLSNLDARLRLEMRGQLGELVKSSGTTAIYVTHDQKEALSMADRIAVMNDGRIVQTGTPSELYETPGTRFVADFLGEANFIEGTLAESGSPAKVLTPLGELLVRDSGGRQAGDKVACCIRPERVTISPGGQIAGQANTFPATVNSAVYLGDLRQYSVRLAGERRQLIWKASSLPRNEAAFESGQEVTVRVKAEDVCVLGG